MKKIILYVLIAIIVLTLLLSALIVVPIKINDYSLEKYSKEVMESIEIPENTEIVEFISGCGNSTGAGDHTDLYVAVLLKSELSWEELAETFGRVHIVETRGDKTTAMDIIGIEFETDMSGKGYYIVEFRKQGLLDLRGC